MWLDADTLIRERTNGRRSLDDFARAFFGINDGSWVPVTYTFDDVVAALNAVLEHDWATFLRERIDEAGTEPPLDGLTRGGYRLVFKEERSAFQREAEAYGRNADFSYSLGLSFGENGNVTGVQWDGPAFNQGVTVGTQVVAVNGVAYGNETLRRAITAAKTDASADRAAAEERRSVSDDRRSRIATACAIRISSAMRRRATDWRRFLAPRVTLSRGCREC